MCSQDNGDMKKQHALFKQYGTINDWIVTGALLAVATCLSYIFFHIMDNPTANIALCYILALFLTARFTSGYFYGLFASLFGVVCVNFLFTYPYFALDFTLTHHLHRHVFHLHRHKRPDYEYEGTGKGSFRT